MGPSPASLEWIAFDRDGLFDSQRVHRSDAQLDSDINTEKKPQEEE